MERLEYIRQYLQSILPIFRLDQWDIRVADWEPPPPDSVEAAEDAEESKTKDLLAYIIVEDECRGAAITLHREFYDQTPAIQQQALAHELCHCIVAQYTIDVAPLLELVRDKTARRMIETMLNRREELLTDEIACMLLPRLPAYCPP